MRLKEWLFPIVAAMAVGWPLLGAAPACAETQQKKDPAELVSRIKNAPLEDLKKLSFLELNFLKNAIFASRGYRFANDRPWLNEFFCGKSGTAAKKSTAQSVQGMLSSWTAKLRDEARWDLSEYNFPACNDSGPITEGQKKAIANVRIAVFKKIETYGTIADVDKALDKEMNAVPTNSGWAWILGKPIKYPHMQALGAVSIRRDIHGQYNVLSLARRNESFDSMELLGLFAGDIMFLRSLIEAQNGKELSGVLGWEVSQIIGITPRRSDYDPEKLPTDVREKLRRLEDIVGKIMRSDLNDIPESLKDKAIEFNDPYDFEGC